MHVAVMAYGQTGTGKTHTMLGQRAAKSSQVVRLCVGYSNTVIATFNNLLSAVVHIKLCMNIYVHMNFALQSDLRYPDGWGIIPRALNDLLVKTTAVDGGQSTTMAKCSYMQIYNNKLYDLLKPQGKRQKPLQVYQA